MPRPEPPKDYADDWDPYKTDPLYGERLTQVGDDPDNTAPYQHHSSGYREEHEVPDMASHHRPKRVIGKLAPELPQLSHERSMFKPLLDFFIPPLNDHPESVRRWRISVGLSLLILFMNLTLSYGWYQIFGFSGFAYASTVKDIKVGLIEQQIFEITKSHCLAPTEESKGFYAKRRAELFRRYEDEMRAAYSPKPSCRDLGVREVIVGEP